jgi:hypothetical protein
MIFQMTTTEMNWRMVELYVKISSIGNAGYSLNNLPESINRTENIIPSTINLAHQIHKSDPQRFIYPTLVSPNITDEWEQNDEGDDVRNEDNDVLEEEERNDDDLYPFQQMDGRLEKIIETRLMKMMTQIMILINI